MATLIEVGVDLNVYVAIDFAHGRMLLLVTTSWAWLRSIEALLVLMPIGDAQEGLSNSKVFSH